MSNSAMEGWRDFRPSKSFIFWSFVAGIVTTLVVGFAGFGWYTSGGAHALADNAAEEAQTKLASSVCVERFMRAPDAAAQLAALKEESTWSRDTFIQDGGWTTFKGYDRAFSDAAEACADTLVEMQPPASVSTTAGDAS